MTVKLQDTARGARTYAVEQPVARLPGWYGCGSGVREQDHNIMDYIDDGAVNRVGTRLDHGVMWNCMIMQPHVLRLD